jgi:hypothetical protein
VSQPLNRARRPDEEAATSLAKQLEQFATTLPVGERAILGALVEAAMPPLDRLALRQPGELLGEGELQALNEVLAQGERDH